MFQCKKSPVFVNGTNYVYNLTLIVQNFCCTFQKRCEQKQYIDFAQKGVLHNMHALITVKKFKMLYLTNL